MTRRYTAEGVRDLFDVEPLTPGEVNELIGLRDDEIIIDLFAGGGGASKGIEWGTGRSPDEAVNHSPAAIAIHALNHPKARHHPIDIWKADPVEVARGRRVGLLWFSADCTHHSRAKGGKPVSKKLRCLPHVAIRYAKSVRPRLIIGENVPELLSWGPVSRDTGRPDPKRKGHSFRGWCRQLRRLGYVVEYRTLRGMFYGAPTTRERLFIIARCDGQPIRWPEPTHGVGRTPVRTAAECLDFSLPCPSIFLTPEEAKAEGKRIGRRIIRPLKPATHRRIARGVHRFVLTAAEPFIIPLTHHGDARVHSLRDPLPTITGANRGEHALIAPYFIPRYGEDPHRNAGRGQAPRSLPVNEPFPAIVPTGNGAQLIAAFLSKNYTERHPGEVMGSDLRSPLATITAQDHHALMEVRLSELAGDRRIADRSEFVAAFLSIYYGNEDAGQSLGEPLRTITPHDRMALVTVTIRGAEYVLADIGQRMLTAREQANGQGFPPDYVLDGFYVDPKTGKRRRITETDQKDMVGNSVNPQIAAALCLANFGAPMTKERAA